MYLTQYHLVFQESNANELKIQTAKAITQSQPSAPVVCAFHC